MHESSYDVLCRVRLIVSDAWVIVRCLMQSETNSLFLYIEEGCSYLRLLPSSHSGGTRQISNRASNIAFHFGVCLSPRWGEIHLQAWGVHCGSIKQHHSSSLVIILLGIPDHCQLLSTRNWTTCTMCSLRTCMWYNERGPTLLDVPSQQRFPCWKFFFPKSPLSKIKAHFIAMLPLTNLLILLFVATDAWQEIYL
jgi:hypothetical protein